MRQPGFMKIKFVPVLLALALRLHPVQADLLVNGGFEATTNGTTLSYISLGAGSTEIPGWTTTNAEITWDGPLLGISPALTAAQGSDFLDLTGTHDHSPYGGVFQTMTTTTGQEYQVSFEVGSDKYYDTVYTGAFVAPVVAVSLNGIVTFSATNNFPNLTNYWQTWSFYFTADTASTTLMLTATTSSRVAYIGLDNVMVTPGSTPPVIVLSAPLIAQGHAQIPFTLSGGAASTFELLQSPQITGPWVTNRGAVLATNVPGAAYTFSVPTAGADEFYRVQTP
jgi:hypothetical protein